VTRFRVLVAEDEPLARAMVADLARRDAEVACVFECGDVGEARELLAQHDIDIAFLDIEMPGATGVELAATLSPEGPAVVFVTAFSRYAPSAFDVDAVDYVLKPFSDDRFFAALDRAKRRVRERRLGAIASQLASGPTDRRAPRDAASGAVSRLAFKEGDRSVVLNAAEIVWVEAEDYYVLVHSARGRHMLRATLASLEERLDPHVFLRVHRAALVNLNEVREVRDEGKLVLVLSNGARVPVSRTRRRIVEATVMPRFRA
jgi:two-component system LytT family response regulator